tara:strand:- start:807 stop:1118 length:312 start_codon:yes stop_codon:yes gene_type:complete
MSIIISRNDLKNYFKSGDKPTSTNFQNLIDSIPMIYSETVDLVASTNYTITHGNATSARIVQALDSSTNKIAISWKRDPADPTNKIIINYPSTLTGVIVNVLC